jgi:hypothetical protein
MKSTLGLLAACAAPALARDQNAAPAGPGAAGAFVVTRLEAVR